MDRDHVHSDHGDDDYINASSNVGACGLNSNLSDKFFFLPRKA